MNRLEQNFAADIDFFVLDIDLSESRTYLDQYAIRTRSTYVLLNNAGEEVIRWNGPLIEEQITEELEAFLETAK